MKVNSPRLVCSLFLKATDLGTEDSITGTAQLPHRLRVCQARVPLSLRTTVFVQCPSYAVRECQPNATTRKPRRCKQTDRFRRPRFLVLLAVTSGLFSPPHFSPSSCFCPAAPRCVESAPASLWAGRSVSQPTGASTRASFLVSALQPDPPGRRLDLPGSGRLLPPLP